MIDPVFKISSFLRAVVYASITIISGIVASSYYRAYIKEKPTWIIQSVIYLFASLFFSYLFFLLASITALIEGAGEKYKFIVSILFFTNLPVLFAIINFWNASISGDDKQKLKVDKN